MFWPGSEVAIGEQRPPDWLRYDRHVGYVQRVNTILDWMRRPADIRPAFATLYFEAVDDAGHRFGPDSAEVNAAIRSEEHTSELQSLMRISYAVFCLKKKRHSKT